MVTEFALIYLCFKIIKNKTLRPVYVHIKSYPFNVGIHPLYNYKIDIQNTFNNDVITLLFYYINLIIYFHAIEHF